MYTVTVAVQCVNGWSCAMMKARVGKEVELNTVQTMLNGS